MQAYRRPKRRRGRLLIAAALVIAVALFVAWAVSANPEPAPKRVRATRPPDPAATKAAQAVRVASFLGGARRDLGGFGPAPKRLDLKWKLSLGSGTTRRKVDNAVTTWSGCGWTGQPTVVKDADKTWLLLGAYDHNLHRINAATGKVKWEARWPDVMKGTNTVVPNPRPTNKTNRIIVVSGSRRGSDLAVGDKRIAPLRAVSFATGQELWRLPVPRTDNYSQDVDSSPLWYRGILYAPVESGYVYALDPFKRVKRGGHYEPTVLARSPRLYDAADKANHPDIGGANLAIEASPSAIGDRIYVTSGAGHVYGLNSRTLKVEWDFKTGSDLDGSPVVTSDNRLLVTVEKQYTSANGGAYLLDPTKPPKDAVVWYYPTPTSGFGEWAGGSVGSITTNERGDNSRPRLAALSTIDGLLRVVSLDQTTGSRAKGPGAARKAPAPVEVFTDRIGASISTPIITGDRIVTAGYDQKVRLYQISYKAAAEGDTNALPDSSGRFWKVRVKHLDTFMANGVIEATPLVYGGRVYIGSRDGNLYCLGD